MAAAPAAPTLLRGPRAASPGAAGTRWRGRPCPCLRLRADRPASCPRPAPAGMPALPMGVPMGRAGQGRGGRARRAAGARPGCPRSSRSTGVWPGLGSPGLRPWRPGPAAEATATPVLRLLARQPGSAPGEALRAAASGMPRATPLCRRHRRRGRHAEAAARQGRRPMPHGGLGPRPSAPGAAGAWCLSSVGPWRRLASTHRGRSRRLRARAAARAGQHQLAARGTGAGRWATPASWQPRQRQGVGPWPASGRRSGRPRWPCTSCRPPPAGAGQQASQHPVLAAC